MIVTMMKKKKRKKQKMRRMKTMKKIMMNECNITNRAGRKPHGKSLYLFCNEMSVAGWELAHCAIHSCTFKT